MIFIHNPYDAQNFVIAPDVIHADQVVIQSEAMRQIYIDILTKHCGEKSRLVWEKRILGLGSPKTDKVKTSKATDFGLPVEWRNCIYSEDGSHKRVIFYDTSINTRLRYGSDILLKMKDVFQTFWKRRDEFTLLWRPHPLTEAPITSMRPGLWEDYKKLVEGYREEGWAFMMIPVI